MLLKFKLILLVLITLVLNINTQAFATEEIENKDAIYLENDNFADGIDRLQEEAQVYHEKKDTTQEIETILKISQKYTELGQFRLALITLNKAKTYSGLNSHTKARIYLGIGNAYSANGNFKQAISAYQDSFNEEALLSVLNNLVKTYRNLKQSTVIKAKAIDNIEDAQTYDLLTQAYESQAIKYSKQALLMADNETSASAVYALIEWNRLGKKLDFRQLAKGQKIINDLPVSKSLVYLLINWATVDTNRSVYWLGEAEKIALKFKEPELQSYTYLALGYFFQRKQNWSVALEYANKAYSKSKVNLANESNYRSLKLMGDLHLKIGEKSKALENYRDTIFAIDALNKTVSSSNNDRLIKFNLEIQPIYKEALNILLEQPDTSPTELAEALVISDKFRLSQLTTYFGEDCFEVSDSNISTKKRVATINSIVLDDKVFFILRLPNGKISKSSRIIDKSKLTQKTQQWREELKTGLSWQFRDRSKYFYDLIVKPFESELESADSNIKALVFVHDGVLRNIPMAALLDENDYLIEKYPISSSLGLKISSLSHQTSKVNALLFGLSDPLQLKWRSLGGVRQEIEQIQNLVDSTDFLNKDFTFAKLTEELQENSYSILHLATHGYFGGSAENSFILAYDQEVPIPKLEKVLQSSESVPNLLILSACETAVGSELSVLGLAGSAAKSGVDSTLGTLWQVGDRDQLEVIQDFYSGIQGNLENKEKALQQAQIKQIRKLAHPQKWAALNLISNY